MAKQRFESNILRGAGSLRRKFLQMATSCAVSRSASFTRARAKVAARPKMGFDSEEIAAKAGLHYVTANSPDAEYEPDRDHGGRRCVV